MFKEKWVVDESESDIVEYIYRTKWDQLRPTERFLFKQMVHRSKEKGLWAIVALVSLCGNWIQFLAALLAP